MQRFRLLGFYVVGVVSLIGLAVWGVSLRRTAADAGPPTSGTGENHPFPRACSRERPFLNPMRRSRSVLNSNSILGDVS
jgi:hypothetical protein